MGRFPFARHGATPMSYEDPDLGHLDSSVILLS
jgi:hypothetical protein